MFKKKKMFLEYTYIIFIKTSRVRKYNFTEKTHKQNENINKITKTYEYEMFTK